MNALGESLIKDAGFEKLTIKAPDDIFAQIKYSSEVRYQKDAYLSAASSDIQKTVPVDEVKEWWINKINIFPFAIKT